MELLDCLEGNILHIIFCLNSAIVCRYLPTRGMTASVCLRVMPLLTTVSFTFTSN